MTQAQIYGIVNVREDFGQGAKAGFGSMAVNAFDHKCIEDDGIGGKP